MRVSISVFVAGMVLLGLGAPAQATIYPQRGMSGIVLGMTTAEVHARLGTPTVGAGRWYYPRVRVGFRAMEELLAIQLAGLVLGGQRPSLPPPRT